MPEMIPEPIEPSSEVPGKGISSGVSSRGSERE